MAFQNSVRKLWHRAYLELGQKVIVLDSDLFGLTTAMEKKKKVIIYLCAAGSLLALGGLFVVWLTPYNRPAKSRDSIVLEWRAKFYELESVASSYRESIDEPDRIFPESFGILHQWINNEESPLLKNKHDLLKFEADVNVIYRTYGEIEDGGVDLDSFLLNEVPVVEKAVVVSRSRQTEPVSLL